MGGESNNVPKKTIISYLKEVNPEIIVKVILGIISTLIIAYITISIPFYFETNNINASNTKKIDTLQTQQFKLENRVTILEKNPELNPELKKYLENILENQKKLNDRQDRIETKQDNSEARDDRMYNIMLKSLEH